MGLGAHASGRPRGTGAWPAFPVIILPPRGTVRLGLNGHAEATQVARPGPRLPSPDRGLLPWAGLATGHAEPPECAVWVLAARGETASVRCVRSAPSLAGDTRPEVTAQRRLVGQHPRISTSAVARMPPSPVSRYLA